MNIKNTFHQALSVSDTKASFGDPVVLKTNTVMSLIPVVKECLQMSSGIDESLLTITSSGEDRPYLVRYNRVLVGMLVHPLDGNGEEIPTPFANGKDWFAALKAIAERHPECAVLIDSMPSCMNGIDKVGDSHVIVPDSEHMTEEMIDASRSLLLYTDTSSDHSAVSIRDRIGSSPWFKRVVPKWFAEEQQHLTKAGRAILAYDLTIKSHTHPATEEERKWGTRRPAYTPRVIHGYRIVLNAGQGKELVISRAFGTRFKPEKVGDIIDLQINRHQLPEGWKQFFTKQAVSFKGTVEIGEDGVSTVRNGELVINLRKTAESLVSWKIEPSVIITQ